MSLWKIKLMYVATPASVPASVEVGGETSAASGEADKSP